MENLTSSLDIENNPFFLFLANLIQNCYRTNSSYSQLVAGSIEEDTGVFCPRTFDGFACWDWTPAGATAYQNCPYFITGFDRRRYAYKQCMEDGTWFKLSPEAPKPWTNYTTCVDFEDLEFRSLVNNIYVTGYAISAVALVLSLIIFCYFRSLQCTRTRIHMHLFASFVINNLLWILWYKAVINNVNVILQNEVWCQFLHVTTHYFMVTSYFWMFCEGLYLYTALVVVFVREETAMIWFPLIGWGAPFLIMALYSTVRYISGATHRCWMDYTDTFWIIVVPIVLTLFASCGFLACVVRVLWLKLRPAPNQHTAATKKAVKAILLLIPLFGLHFILIPFQPSPESPFERFYQILSSLLTSFQGACVAILFCFTNNDVITAIKTHLARRNQSDGLPMTGVTGVSMNTRQTPL